MRNAIKLIIYKRIPIINWIKPKDPQTIWLLELDKIVSQMMIKPFTKITQLSKSKL